MNLKIFSIFDSKAEAYITPFFLPNTALAVRAFANCVNSDTHQFGTNPADYTLFLIGDFNDNDAELIPCVPRSLGNGLEFKTSEPVDTVDEFDNVKQLNFGGTN